MSQRKKLKAVTFVGSSKLTVIKRANRRIEKSFLCYPLFFGVNNTKIEIPII